MGFNSGFKGLMVFAKNIVIEWI